MCETHRKFCDNIKLGTWLPPHSQSTISECPCMCFPVNTCNILHALRGTCYLNIPNLFSTFTLREIRTGGLTGLEEAVKGRIMSTSDTCCKWVGENVTTKTWIGLVLKSPYTNRISFDMNGREDFRSMNCSPPVSTRLSLSLFLHTLLPLQNPVKIYDLGTSGFPVPCNETRLQRSSLDTDNQVC
jgi:hypothetical protein